MTNAVPASTTPHPAIVLIVICSPRNKAPQSVPKIGTRNVTVNAFAGPTSTIRRK